MAVAPVETNGRSRGGDAGIRPERFARLVTLATVLISLVVVRVVYRPVEF